jgi:peroxiredoxin (alkyl hydroperoxide reductase subunit C)
MDDCCDIECCTRAVRVGETVPDFKMTTYDPKTGDFGTFDLAAQKKAGKWSILVFYPADFTFVCATEFQALAELYPQFTALGAEIVTVSRDTQFTHLAWHQHEGELKDVKYPMGADVKGEVGEIFGVVEEGSGLTLRGTFIISPEGTLTNSEINFFNVGRNMDELLRKLKANTYLAKAPAEVCPAKWKSAGDATLKPSAKMVGKVHEALSAPKKGKK